MSMKDVATELFTQYGLVDDEIKVYIGYLGMPQATVSQIMSLLEMDYDTVKNVTDKLEEAKFLKKIEGIVDRYIPLEPFFSLFAGFSKNFRDEISLIKDNVLADIFGPIRLSRLDSGGSLCYCSTLSVPRCRDLSSHRSCGSHPPIRGLHVATLQPSPTDGRPAAA